MAPSQRNGFIALAVGGAAAGALYHYWPGLPWWVYAIVGFVCFSGFLQGWNEAEAHERIIDRQ